MEHMYDDWKSFKSKTELDILGDYASTAKLLTEVFTLFALVGLIMTIWAPTAPLLLDVVLPLNESRERKIYIEVEYFVDPSEYFGPLALHVTICLCSGILTTVATGTMFYGYALHACGVFKIVK
ncbi:uncharacterized protein LOC116845919 [Odontomachus brunneus]|uniref:uncharacterized protein LOC116845919 n=1 Tax=Odontomachus brunneus TaxID=486640 RepID=UPI0013F245C4|nr:uncharacterized protein LOC116845919 [Odontomachus brunneus]